MELVWRKWRKKMKLLIKFPSRGRPGKFMRVFNMYKNMLSGKRDVSFLLSFDEDDVTMNNNGMKNWLKTLGPNAHIHFGNSSTKIEACNADLDKAPDFDIILLASDDMIPVQEGYDDIICSDMEKYFPDTDGVLWYSDGLVGSKLNTLSIMGKKYFDRFGYMYNPEYKSVFCDNEFMEVSLILGKCKYSEKVLIEHQWLAKTPPNDPLHIKNDTVSNYKRDSLVFLKRRAENFGLKREDLMFKLTHEKEVNISEVEKLDDTLYFMKESVIIKSIEKIQ